jgi:hypothetical protein
LARNGGEYTSRYKTPVITRKLTCAASVREFFC